MILVFGGTTEGRLAAKTLDEAGTPFFYSTRGDMQQVDGKNLKHISGAMDCEAMTSFCRLNLIRCIVDAAHPFASELHQTISSVAAGLDIPVIRLERQYAPHGTDGVVWCGSFSEAIDKSQTT